MALRPKLRRLTLIDQTAGHLREAIREGRWKHHLPGAIRLAEELGVSRNTTVAAISRLITEGLVLPATKRHPHALATTTDTPDEPPARRLRTAMLMMTSLEKHSPFLQREIMRIMFELKTDGYECIPVVFPAGKTPIKTGYLPRLLHETDVDAWLVFTGTREILEWFSARPETPVFAVGGRCKDLPIAAAATSDVAQTVRDITRRLLALGHRRIVLIAEVDRRKPKPGRMILAFREELEAAGIKPGEFNTPDWEETPEGLVVLLKSLFRFTPPTALICNNMHTTCGAATFLTRIGLNTPADVSIVSLAPEDPFPAWTFPGTDFAHVEEDDRTSFRRIREWVTQVAENRADTRQVWSTAKLVEGNTIGPAKEPRPR
jgi:DNA-binding LacI/PurR family transcriptional regulator